MSKWRATVSTDFARNILQFIVASVPLYITFQGTLSTTPILVSALLWSSSNMSSMKSGCRPLLVGNMNCTALHSTLPGCIRERGLYNSQRDAFATP